jgi:hypothetical protein
MRRRILITIFITVGTLLFAACSGNKDSAASTVEAYLNALVSQDSNQISVLSCKEWEPQALLELDSFQAVKVSLEGLSCSTSGSEGDTILVACQGKILASYNDENQEFDLSQRTYEVVEEGGEMRVCGYK